MPAIRMLVGAAWRRQWRASLFLAVVAGLAASVVGASFQAAARADTSVARFNQRSRIYDALVQGCPPEVDPDSLEGEADALARCVSVPLMERLRGVLDKVEGVERTALSSTSVLALLDPSVSNHWGRIVLLAGAVTPGAPLPAGKPIVVEGRVVDPAAPDEIVVAESAARATGIHAGDVVGLASWRQVDLDAAIDGTVPPQTPTFTSRVVGVVRYLDDAETSAPGRLSDSTLPGNINLFAGPGWMARHAADLPGYGTGVLVRLRGGPSSMESFQAALDQAPGGWQTRVDPASDVDVATVEHVIDLERRALLVFAIIAILAGAVFVGLTALRQLRRESADSGRLMALGMTRRDLHLLNVCRSLTIAAPACLVAAVGIVALSPIEPLGLAHRLEFVHPFRLDLVVLAATVLAVLVLFALAGLATPVEAANRRRSPAGTRATRLDHALLGLGPVAVVGATIARGRSSRAAIAVTAIALAAGIAAGGVVASFDRLVGGHERYGAWWDVAVGQYSEQAPLDAGVAKLRANPAVVAAAGYYEQSGVATIDGRSTWLLSTIDFIGHRGPIIASGRPPAADDEVALGGKTARQLGKGIGDQVTVRSASSEVTLRVVGTVVVNNPIASDSGAAGQGTFVRPSVFVDLVGRAVAQSVVVTLDPRRPRATAIESVRRDFSGSIREPSPQAAVRNLGRLRAVPWLIAALIAILALATLLHALVTLLARNRNALAVLAVLGFTRGQRRGACVFATVALVLVGVVVGIPFGLLVGAHVWRSVADGVGLPSGSVLAWRPLVVAPIGVLGVAALVALSSSRGSVRATPSEQLRVE
jgi:hypothetical protein